MYLGPASFTLLLLFLFCFFYTRYVTILFLDIKPFSLFRQGGLLVNFHPSILSCLLPQLTSPRLAVRKRTIIALGHLVMSCGNLVFVDLSEHLLSELSRNESIAAISRQAGHRIGETIMMTPLCVFLFPHLN